MAIAVAFLPMMLIGAALTLSSGRIEDRFGRRRIITVGIPLRPPGWSRSGTPAWMLAALMLPVELCGPTVMPPATAARLRPVPHQQSGTASGTS